MSLENLDLALIGAIGGTAAVILLILFGFRLFNNRLLSHYEGRSHLVFRRQLIQLGGIMTAVLIAILTIPLFDGELRGQLLSLFGIIVSATIALSSTTLVGNVMAGIMLRTISNFKPGDYITVGSYFGRVSEMDLLHVEIQTEQRDLTTLPNMYLVTNPVRVMQSSGTIIDVELSLGYDVSRHQIESLLKEAARATGLSSPYVQIRALGDFSVTYVIAGLLTEANLLIAKRRELRARTMDLLHEADIEIVSPTFMNTRAHSPDATFIPESALLEQSTDDDSPDALVFDKAEKAESVTRLRERLDELQQRLKERKELAATTNKEAAKAAAEAECLQFEQRIERLKAVIDRRESEILTQ